MISRDDYISLGKIVKTRGISGDLVIRSNTKLPEIKSKWNSVWIEIEGLLVPFFISSFSCIKDNEILIDLEDIDLPEKAEKLKGMNAFISKSDIGILSTEYFKEQIVGYIIRDIHSGEIGEVTGIDEIPGNYLFRVAYRNREILIPIQEDLIRGINKKKRLILIELPHGFLEI